MATLRMISPRATAGRMAFLCWALAASSTMRAPSTPELQNGPGTGPRPSSSKSTAASVSVLSLRRAPRARVCRASRRPRPCATARAPGSTSRAGARRSCASAPRARRTSGRTFAASPEIRSGPGPWSGALVLLQALQDQPAVAPGGARCHRHGHEDRLGDFSVTGAGHGRLLRVSLDAPRALGDLRDAERDQLFALLRQRAVLERDLVEVEEGAIRLRHQLAHPLELRPDVNPMKLHRALLM